MNKEEKIEVLENALKHGYTAGNVNLSDLSGDWKKSQMSAVRSEYSPDDLAVDILEKKFFFISWAAAGIAAALMLVSGIVYSLNHDDLNNEIQALYPDTSIETLAAVIAE